MGFHIPTPFIAVEYLRFIIKQVTIFFLFHTNPTSPKYLMLICKGFKTLFKIFYRNVGMMTMILTHTYSNPFNSHNNPMR